MLWPSPEAISMGSLVASLRGTLVIVASAAAWTRGHPGFTENSGGSGLEETVGQRSQASPLRPLDGLHRCCV